MVERSIHDINEDEVREFVRTRFTHLSGEEFCRLTNRNIENYMPIHMRAAFVTDLPRDTQTFKAEMELARESISEGYEFVAHADYLQNELIVTAFERNDWRTIR